MKSLNGLTLQLVDLRDEIARYEREFRPFPPLSGSVSKPRRSTEPETESGYKHLKFACPGEGQSVQYALDLKDIFMKNLDEAFYDVGYEAMKIKRDGLLPSGQEYEKLNRLIDELAAAEIAFLKEKGSI